MDLAVIHFVLVDFQNHMPEDKARSFVALLVGKSVMLRMNDNNTMDRNCVDVWYGNGVVGHVSDCNAPVVREVMKSEGTRCLFVKVKNHNLDGEFISCCCEYTLKKPITDDFIAEHLKLYSDWHYEGARTYIAPCQESLMAHFDYIRFLLSQDELPEDELLPAIDGFIKAIPMAFSQEDVETRAQICDMLLQSDSPHIISSRPLISGALRYLSDSEAHTASVRKWIDELKQLPSCIEEAEELGAEELAARKSNLSAFPENIFRKYERDFATFSGNLYYNKIPSEQIHQLMSGIAVYELASERLSRAESAATRKEVRYVEVEHYEDMFNQSRLDSLVDYLDNHNLSEQSIAAIIAENECILYKSAATPEQCRRMEAISRKYTERAHMTSTAGSAIREQTEEMKRQTGAMREQVDATRDQTVYLDKVAAKKTIGTIVLDQHNHGIDPNEINNKDNKYLA